jgi:hypothetical protein
MFNLICVAVLLILALFISFFAPVDETGAIKFISYGLLGVSAIWLIGSTINSLCSYSGQLKRFENLKSSLKKINVLEEKSTRLMEEFKSYLGNIYPELEKEIFSNISGSNDLKSSDKLKIIVTKYPEIKSSKVLLKLAKRIESLLKDIYDLKIYIEEQCSDIRYYASGKWELIKPKVPADIRELVYSPLPAKSDS